MKQFEDWVAENPDELVIIHINHCLTENNFLKGFEEVTCLTPQLTDQFRNRNWAILNECGPDLYWKECNEGQCLKTLTVKEAKVYAATGEIGGTVVKKQDESKDRVPGILVIIDGGWGVDQQKMVNDHFIEEVHNDWGAMIGYTNGYLGEGDQWKIDWTDATDKKIYSEMQTYQGHWQSSAGGLNPVPADVQDDKSLNEWIASPDEPIMKNMASGKVNMVDVNWVCDSEPQRSLKPS